MSSASNTTTFLSNAEMDKISRAVLVWLNEYEDKPVGIINYEYLEQDGVSIALSTIQSAYIIRKYLYGGYLAQYQFKIIYRLQPTTNNDRLSADEFLNALGDWATTREDKPTLSDGVVVRRFECNTRSSLFARYEDGSEDHQILMTMTYEVI